MRRSLIAAILLLTAQPLATCLAQEPDRRAAVPTFFDIALSPSGKYLAARAYIDGRIGIVVYDPGAGRLLLANPSARPVNWLRWADDRRLLVSVRMRDPQSVTAYRQRLMLLDVESGRQRDLYDSIANSIVRIDRGTVVRDLVIERNPVWRDRLVAILPAAKTRLLLEYSATLYELDLDSERLSRVHRPLLDDTHFWFADRSGEARLLRTIDWTRRVQRTFVRNGEATTWTEVASHRTDALPVFVPLTFDRVEADRVHVVSAHTNGTLGLYGWKTTTGAFDEAPIAPLREGLLGVVSNPQRTEIYGLRYLAATGHVEWLDPDHAEVERRIAAALPDRVIRVLSVSDGLRRVVVAAGAPNGPGDYYVYDRQDGALLHLGAAYRDWPDHPIAPVRAVQIRGADGASFDAYLSLPTPRRDTEAARKSVVVIVRADGYPHDFFDFDPLVQLLNQRGYTVLQLHDRRRLRFPDEAAAPLYAWTPAPPDDLLAASDWLVREGLAGASSVCAVGLGYGGYTVLMAAALATDPYACVVSANGPMNLDLLGQNPRYAALPVNPEPQSSPVNHATSIVAPVLLVHGAENKLVTPDHARGMRAQLDRLDRRVEYLVLEAEDHELSTVEAQATFLRTLLAFLGEHLDRGIAQ